MVQYLSSMPFSRIYLPVVYIFIGVFSYLILKKIIDQFFDKGLDYFNIKRRRKKTLEIIIKNITRYIVAIVVLVSVLHLFNVDARTILTGFGIIGLVIGLGLQDIVKDFFSGLFIIFDNKYDIGDVIKVDDYRGEVISLGLRSTRIKNIDGDIKVIANRNITEVTNYSLDKTRASIDIAISNDFEVQEIEKVLTEIFKDLDGKIEYVVDDIILLGVNKVDVLATTYRMVVKCDPIKHPHVERAILRELKIRLDKKKIKIISLVGGQL